MKEGFELVRHPSPADEVEGWVVGYQLALNGKLAPMFNLHKSRIRECKNDVEYEELLCDSAAELMQAVQDGQLRA